jgi:small GTP-binding protein
MKTEVPEAQSRSRELNVCLVGMPNAGKTTLMNAITGGNFRTANYPGVTVSLLQGKSKSEFGPALNIVDLPGVHSHVAPSPEEELACRVIEGKHARVRPDAFVLVVDATQLERHIKFAGFVAKQGKPLVVALTMTDLLPRMRLSVDATKLAAALGVPVVPVDARTGAGVPDLVKTLYAFAGAPLMGSALARLPDEPVAGFNAVRELLRKSQSVRRVGVLSVGDTGSHRFASAVGFSGVLRRPGIPVCRDFLGSPALHGRDRCLVLRYRRSPHAGVAQFDDRSLSRRRSDRRRWSGCRLLPANHDSVFSDDVARGLRIPGARCHAR